MAFDPGRMRQTLEAEEPKRGFDSERMREPEPPTPSWGEAIGGATARGLSGLLGLATDLPYGVIRPIAGLMGFPGGYFEDPPATGGEWWMENMVGPITGYTGREAAESPDPAQRYAGRAVEDLTASGPFLAGGAVRGAMKPAIEAGAGLLRQLYAGARTAASRAAPTAGEAALVGSAALGAQTAREGNLGPTAELGAGLVAGATPAIAAHYGASAVRKGVGLLGAAKEMVKPSPETVDLTVGKAFHDAGVGIEPITERMAYSKGLANELETPINTAAASGAPAVINYEQAMVGAAPEFAIPLHQRGKGAHDISRKIRDASIPEAPSMADTGFADVGALGSQVRSGLRSRYTALREHGKQMLENPEIAPGKPLPKTYEMDIGPLQEGFRELEAPLSFVDDAPQTLKKVLRRESAVAPDSEILDAKGKPLYPPEELPPRATFEELDRARREAGDAKRRLKNSDPTKSWMYGRVERQINDFFDNHLPGGAAEYLKGARKWWAENVVPMEKGTTGDVLQDRYNQPGIPKIDDSKVLSTYWRTPDKLKEITRKFPNPTTEKAVREYAIREAPLDKSNTAMDGWIKRNQSQMDLLPGLEEKVRTEQLAFRQNRLREAIQKAGTSSKTDVLLNDEAPVDAQGYNDFVNRNQKEIREVMGQEGLDKLNTLAQKLLVLENQKPRVPQTVTIESPDLAATVNPFLSRMYNVARGIVGEQWVVSERVARVMAHLATESTAKRVNDLGMKALLDPDLAQVLASKYTERRVKGMMVPSYEFARRWNRAMTRHPDLPATWRHLPENVREVPAWAASVYATTRPQEEP